MSTTKAGTEEERPRGDGADSVGTVGRISNRGWDGRKNV